MQSQAQLDLRLLLQIIFTNCAFMPVITMGIFYLYNTLFGLFLI